MQSRAARLRKGLLEEKRFNSVNQAIIRKALQLSQGKRENGQHKIKKGSRASAGAIALENENVTHGGSEKPGCAAPPKKQKGKTYDR